MFINEGLYIVIRWRTYILNRKSLLNITFRAMNDMQNFAMMLVRTGKNPWKGLKRNALVCDSVFGIGQNR